jgi:hypothetical protein
MEMALSEINLEENEAHTLFALLASLASQFQSSYLLKGGNPYSPVSRENLNLFLADWHAPLPTSFVVTPEIQSELVSLEGTDPDITPIFTEPDFSLISYKELLAVEDEFLISLQTTRADSSPMELVIAKLISILLGTNYKEVKAALDVWLVRLERGLGYYLDDILKALREVGDNGRLLPWKDRLKKVMALLRSLFNFLFGDKARKEIIEAVGKTAADKLWKRLIAKFLPGIGPTLLLANLAISVYEQVKAPATLATIPQLNPAR